MDYSDLIATFAFVISISSFVLVMWDRRPRLKVGINVEHHYSYDEEIGMEVPEDRRLWINIANHSQKRIWVRNVSVQWTRYLWLSRGWKNLDLPDLQRWEHDSSEPTYRFWIEPWADVVLSSDPDELEYELTIGRPPGRIRYSIIAKDGLGKTYRSNKVKLNIKRKA
jgi:hypothetical protein